MGIANVAINAFCVFMFLVGGLTLFRGLREIFLSTDFSGGNDYIFYAGIRYISFALVAVLLFSTYKYLKEEFLQPFSLPLKIPFELSVHLTILWIASSELVSWMEILKFPESFKLGLSILWGLYSLMLIVLGIWKKKKHLRIAAIVLFGVTLIKLFFYDLAGLDTIAKTIVFVSLGILLLIISFLYNKWGKE